MIPPELRRELVELIFAVPQAATFAGTTALLGGIPGEFVRNPENPRGDIDILVSHLAVHYGPKGEWWLIVFIDNVVAAVAGTDKCDELKRAKQKLLSLTSARAIDPIETAQVHLFDLRQPVFMCLGQLPPNGGVSGFLVPGATHRMLSYFCDSLRYRAATSGVWKRADVRPSPNPLFVGPLQTTVAKAIDHARSFEKALVAKHVVWPVYVESREDAETLWQAVKAIFAQPPPRHFIVVFGSPSDTITTSGMYLLPSPMFTPDEIRRWIGAIARAKAWDESVVERWVAFIVTGCSSGAALPIDIVYHGLERCHALLNEYRDDDEGLLQVLKDLAETGG